MVKTSDILHMRTPMYSKFGHRSPSTMRVVERMQEKTECFKGQYGGITYTMIITTEHDPEAVAEFEKQLAEAAIHEVLQTKVVA